MGCTKAAHGLLWETLGKEHRDLTHNLYNYTWIFNGLSTNFKFKLTGSWLDLAATTQAVVYHPYQWEQLMKIWCIIWTYSPISEIVFDMNGMLE